MRKKQRNDDSCCGNPVLSNSSVSKSNVRKSASKRALTSSNPDHSQQLKGLNRVIGQLQGVQRMIEARRYCPEILVQTRAAASALKRIEMAIMEQHFRTCVADAVEDHNRESASQKIEEIMEILENFR